MGEAERREHLYLWQVHQALHSGRSVEAAMADLAKFAEAQDPEHPAIPVARKLDYRKDAASVAGQLRKLLSSKRLRRKDSGLVFWMDPLNMGRGGEIDITASTTARPDKLDDLDWMTNEMIDAGSIKSTVVAKLYNETEDDEVADLVLGLGYVALAVSRALAGQKREGLLRVGIGYRESHVYLLLGDLTADGFHLYRDPRFAKAPKPAKTRKPAKATKPAAKSFKAIKWSERLRELPVTANDWHLRAALVAMAERGSNAIMGMLRPAVAVGDPELLRQVRDEIAAHLPKVRDEDDRLEAEAVLSFLSRKVGELVSAGEWYAQAKADAAAMPDTRSASDERRIEAQSRGLDYGFSISGMDEVPMGLWVAFLDADRARIDDDRTRCATATKQLTKPVDDAMGSGGRTKVLPIGGRYAVICGYLKDAERVAWIEKRFRDKYGGPKPEQLVEAYLLAGDMAAAERVFRKAFGTYCTALRGKGSAFMVHNPHLCIPAAMGLVKLRHRLGDPAGAAKALEQLEDAIEPKAKAKVPMMAWALAELAEAELRSGRRERAMRFLERAGKFAETARPRDVKEMAWVNVAEVNIIMGRWEAAEAAMQHASSRDDKTKLRMVMLALQGKAEEAVALAKQHGREADLCKFVAGFLDEWAEVSAKVRAG